MSLIIPLSAYGKKRESVKKVKLSTQDRSKKCSISKCGKISVITLQIGIETRRLCQRHHDEAKRKNLKYPVKFEKAKKFV